MQTNVIIIGAGPTGLMAANQLARFGIDFIILDKKSGPTIESRAIAVTARSLEIYEQMGLVETVIEQGEKINSLGVFSDGKAKAGINIGEISSSLSDFNFLLAFEQSKNEELLYKNLKKNGRDVLWEHELVKVSQTAEEVTVTIKAPAGEEKTLTSKYLIAADGARSVVRHQFGFKFEGGTYQNKFFVADTELKWNHPYDRLTLFPAHYNFCAFFPIKGKNTIRVLGTLPKEYAGKENVDFKDLETIIKNTVKVEVTFTKVNWFSVYHLHHRGVDNFRNSNIFLAGDSAHIHSPAGGQGMNTGLQDAYNLAWKMAFVLKGHVNKKILDTYTEERLPFAKWLLNFTDRMFNMMTNDNWFIYFIRKYLMLNIAPLILSSEKIKLRAFTVLSQTWYSYKGKTISANYSQQKLKFSEGDRFPYFKDAKTGKSFYENLKAPSFHLVFISDRNLTSSEQNDIKNYFSFPVTIVQTIFSDNWSTSGVTKELFILVRPDNYIAFISDSLTKETAKQYMKKAGMSK